MDYDYLQLFFVRFCNDKEWALEHKMLTKQKSCWNHNLSLNATLPPPPPPLLMMLLLLLPVRPSPQLHTKSIGKCINVPVFGTKTSATNPIRVKYFNQFLKITFSNTLFLLGCNLFYVLFLFKWKFITFQIFSLYKRHIQKSDCIRFFFVCAYKAKGTRE